MMDTIFDAKLNYKCNHLIGGAPWSRLWTTTSDFETWATHVNEDASTVPGQVQLATSSGSLPFSINIDSLTEWQNGKDGWAKTLELDTRFENASGWYFNGGANGNPFSKVEYSKTYDSDQALTTLSWYWVTGGNGQWGYVFVCVDGVWYGPGGVTDPDTNPYDGWGASPVDLSSLPAGKSLKVRLQISYEFEGPAGYDWFELQGTGESVVAYLLGSAAWCWEPTGIVTQLRTLAFTRADGEGAESKFQVVADGVVYPSPATYFTASPVLFTNVFAKTFEARLFQSRPSGAVNAIVEDFYLAGGGTVFPKDACPRCLGMGNINDVVFDELGKLETVNKVDKLGQELEKGVLILLKSNVFHEEIGSLLKEGTVAPYAVDQAFRDQKLTQSILDVVRLIRDQQQLLKGSQDISPEETIKEVLNVRISSVDDPRHLTIHIDLLTESGATYIYTREVT